MAYMKHKWTLDVHSGSIPKTSYHVHASFPKPKTQDASDPKHFQIRETQPSCPGDFPKLRSGIHLPPLLVYSLTEH